MADGGAGSGRWQFWIDRGGTFTDVVARAPDGALLTHKLLSENPGALSRRRDRRASASCWACRPAQPIPPARSPPSRWARRSPPTRCSSARATARVLVITRGFADALRIGYQNRPDIFARHIVLPELLYERVVEVDERVTAEGEVLTPLDLAGARAATCAAAFDDGIRAVAIVFMHGYRYHRARDGGGASSRARSASPRSPSATRSAR